jgi:hypothetical protein
MSSPYLVLRNSSSDILTLLLEPWGEGYQMDPGATVEVHARGPEGGCLRVEVGDKIVTVYGWPGSLVEFHKSGHKLLGSGSISA